MREINKIYKKHCNLLYEITKNLESDVGFFRDNTIWSNGRLYSVAGEVLEEIGGLIILRGKYSFKVYDKKSILAYCKKNGLIYINYDFEIKCIKKDLLNTFTECEQIEIPYILIYSSEYPKPGLRLESVDPSGETKRHTEIQAEARWESSYD